MNAFFLSASLLMLVFSVAGLSAFSNFDIVFPNGSKPIENQTLFHTKLPPPVTEGCALANVSVYPMLGEPAWNQQRSGCINFLVGIWQLSDFNTEVNHPASICLHFDSRYVRPDLCFGQTALLCDQFVGRFSVHLKLLGPASCRAEHK
ncbi:hypothetical protein [Pseudomonas fluorescens]|uniref:hypothetical protein n=1 Tax=Pseudomonas fluorescens TaxID=294 RepID=UPI0012DA8EDA|nr:hypothetical protein [Pseudomonas fluorescens]